MLRTMRHPKGYEPGATESTYAEQLYRHYAGIPGWRGRDRNVLAMHNRPPTSAAAGSANSAGVDEEGTLERANASVAAHEEDQIRAADAAAVRDAREGRMP